MLSPSDILFRDYLALAQKAKAERRFIFNHLCIRVESLDDATKLLSDSFGLAPFQSPGGETFEGEREYRVSWLSGHDAYLELSEFDTPQQIGYDTGAGQPIGHLSEIGFFVPSMDEALDHLEPHGWYVTSRIDTSKARMYKISNARVPGIPVELIDVFDPEDPDFLT
jgi:catechol 2,3-dioxygenase-like lactoylglutathione lyase family enzyme